MTKLFVPMVVVMLFVTGVVLAISYSPVALSTEYSTKISVDKPDKIENAISNVVANLEKRDFVPVNLEVRWHPVSKTYVVYAGGIDRTKLASMNRIGELK